MSRYTVPASDDLDASAAARTASDYAGDAGEEDFFGSILSSLTGKHQELASEQLDEGHEAELVEQHQAVFGQSDDDGAKLGASSLGGAAAMQALKMFIGGEQMNQIGSSSGGAQNAFVGMAMGEAAKIFESQKAQGNTDPAVSKDSVVQHAAETAVKMYLQSQGSQASSETAGFMGLASRFM